VVEVPADRRFFRALLGIATTVGDPSLHYAEPPPGLRRALRNADRSTLFSIIAECLYLLLDAPAMRVVKRFHRRRKRQAARGKSRRQETADRSRVATPSRTELRAAVRNRRGGARPET
jgi:hypothetical protein